MFSLFLGCAQADYGCLQAPDWEASAAVVNEQSILGTAAHFRDSAAFVRVNGSPYESALDSQVIINVWISGHAFAPYATLDPDIDDTGIVVPEGTIIVREVLNGAGRVQRLTLMAKGPAGYNPELGDFWFGVTRPDGTPLVKAGHAQAGKLHDCYSCHLERAGDDYLFGVPSSNRNDLGSQPRPQLPPVPGRPATPRTSRPGSRVGI